MITFFENETKVLNVDPKMVRKILKSLKAKQLLKTRLVVDWFRTIGIKEGEDKWFLRIRSNSQGETEVTWKGISDLQGASRTSREINISIQDQEKMGDLFEVIGLEKYAHQEKDRISWTYKDWRFELDTYPGMPPFLEIEGKNEEHIQEALKLLSLEKNLTWNDGERTLIQSEYGLNWYDMKFVT